MSGRSVSVDGLRARRRAALLRAGYRYQQTLHAHSETGRAWVRDSDGAEICWWDGTGEYRLRPGRAERAQSRVGDRYLTGDAALLAYLDAEAARNRLLPGEVEVPEDPAADPSLTVLRPGSRADDFGPGPRA